MLQQAGAAAVLYRVHHPQPLLGNGPAFYPMVSRYVAPPTPPLPTSFFVPTPPLPTSFFVPRRSGKAEAREWRRQFALVVDEAQDYAGMEVALARCAIERGARRMRVRSSRR